MKINIKKLHPDAVIPKYQTDGASGFDFHCLENVYIPRGETQLIKTGLAFEIPRGYELQVRPRSGTSLKTTLRIANSPGTVDADYRGEVCIIADNIEQFNRGISEGSITFNKGDRIAQGVIVPVVQAQFNVVDELNNTERGSGGYGSTGQ